MGSGYDGSIRIDTKIDESGFGKGVKNLTSQIKELGWGMALGAARFVSSMATAASQITIIIFGISRLIRGISTAVNRIMSMGGRTQALKQDFANLRVAVGNAFLPLLSVALPLLQQVAQWLTRIFNIIGMVIGALFGQKTVMQATAAATSGAAGSAKKLADETERAEEAAKGSLAAFDEINVLEQEEPPKEPDVADDFGGGGDIGGIGGGVEVPILQGILDFVQKIKDFLEPLKEPLQRLWDSLVGLWDATKKAFEPWIEWAKESGILEFIRDLVILGIDWLSERIQDLTKWIGNNEKAWRIILVVLAAIGLALLLILSPAALVVAIVLAIIAVVVLLVSWWPTLKQAAIDALNGLKVGWGMLADWFRTKVWQPLTNWAANTLNSIGRFFTNLWTNVTSWSANALNSIGRFFLNLSNGAAKVLNAIGAGFRIVFNGVVNVVKGAINLIIGFINGMMSAIATGINTVIGALNSLNFNVPDWVPLIGGQSWGFNISPVSAPQIPLLAQGAVIPPNSQFLAVLGDQRAGRNIETPEGLMRQIVREELEGMQGGQEVTINFAGSLGALVRELKPHIDRENTRIGYSVVRGTS